MIFLSPIAEIYAYFTELKKQIDEISSPIDRGLTASGVLWLSIAVTAILMCGSLCLRRMERSSAGTLRAKALSWVLGRGKFIPWERLISASNGLLFKTYDIKSCQVICDDTFRERSRNTKNIFGVQKLRDKATGGYFRGQNIVFLAVVTPKISFIVGFRFFLPDPEYKAWEANDKLLKRKGVPRKDRPKEPEKSSKYPTRLVIFQDLLKDFKAAFPNMKVVSICADAAYFSNQCATEVNKIYPNVQFISQLRSTQKVLIANQEMSLKEYFSYLKEYKTQVRFRGRKDQKIYFLHEMLFIKSHGKRLKVVAIKYEKDDDYRFLVATDNTWIPRSIIESYSYRWIIETAIEDWKQYNGWGTMASQQGQKSACRGLCLSLLVDHSLLHHPLQRNRHQMGKSLVTTGSLRDHVRFETVKRSFNDIIYSDSPKEKLSQLIEGIDEVVKLRDSLKHMSGTEEFVPYTRSA